MKKSKVTLDGNKKDGWLIDVSEENEHDVWGYDMQLTHAELIALKKLLDKKLK